ncbi:MAG: hypothetical protein IPM49_11680 [Flavobacteriales bacterium]|nr:hypothetical protein [Flavobacteriales bacterium]
MKVFDYVFYRASTFFFKNDGQDADRAIWLVTAIQIFFILDVYLSIAFFAFEDHGKHYHQLVVACWMALLVIVYIMNRLRYRGRYDELQGRFQESAARKIFFGVLIVSTMLFLFFYPVFFLSLFGKSKP